MKMQIKPVKGIDMTTADGKTSQVKGVAVVSVTLQSYKAQLRFLVISMATDCDAILGESLDYSHKGSNDLRPNWPYKCTRL